jgi:hypothetical protein
LDTYWRANADHDAVALDQLSGVRVGHVLACERLLNFSQALRGHVVAQIPPEQRIALAGRGVRQPGAAGQRTRAGLEPRIRVASGLGQTLGGRRGRLLKARDGQRPIEPGHRFPEPRHVVGRRPGAAAGELIAVHLLERHLPAGALVLEGLEADDERPQLVLDVYDDDGCPARVEQPAGPALDKVVKLTRLELGVGGRIGV